MTGPGFLGAGAGRRLAEPGPELISLITDRDRVGTLAHRRAPAHRGRAGGARAAVDRHLAGAGPAGRRARRAGRDHAGVDRPVRHAVAGVGGPAGAGRAGRGEPGPRLGLVPAGRRPADRAGPARRAADRRRALRPGPSRRRRPGHRVGADQRGERDHLPAAASDRRRTRCWSCCSPTGPTRGPWPTSSTGCAPTWPASPARPAPGVRTSCRPRWPTSRAGWPTSSRPRWPVVIPPAPGPGCARWSTGCPETCCGSPTCWSRAGSRPDAAQQPLGPIAVLTP